MYIYTRAKNVDISRVENFKFTGNRLKTFICIIILLKSNVLTMYDMPINIGITWFF